MNSSVLATELSAIADEGLFRTNPVWCIERLVKCWQVRDASWADIPNRLDRLLHALPRHGIHLPQPALVGWANLYGLLPPTTDETEPPRPGVVGLIVDVVCHDTLLVPLATERSSEWRVAPTLPFRPASTLQELLVGLLHSLSIPHLHGVPERFAFTLCDPLGRRSDGPSMHLAGLLAVIRHATATPPCSIEPAACRNRTVTDSCPSVASRTNSKRSAGSVGRVPCWFDVGTPRRRRSTLTSTPCGKSIPWVNWPEPLSERGCSGFSSTVSR